MLLALVLLSAPLEVYRTSVGGVNVSLFRLSVGVAVAYLLVRHARRLRPGALVALLRGRGLVTALVVVAAWMAVTLVLEPINTFLGLRLLATVLVGITAIVAIAVLARGMRLADLLELFALSAVLPLMMGAWQGIAFAAGWSPELPLLDLLPIAEGLEKARDVAQYFGPNGDRARGPFADANHFGAFVCVVLLVSVGLAVRAVLAGDRQRWVGHGALAVAATTMLLSSYSRSAWLGAIAGFLLFGALVVGVLRSRGHSRPLMIAAAAIGVLAVLAAIPLAPRIAERLDSDVPANQISNASHRQTLEEAIDAFGDRPVAGIGIGGLGVRLDQGPRTSGAHSSYLTVAAEQGGVGLLLLLWAVGAAVAILIRALRRHAGALERPLIAGLAAGYAGYLVANVVYDLWWDDFHWVVLGLLLTVDRDGAANVS